MKRTESISYSVNINKEDLIQVYVRQWVFEWCKKYHPEAFAEAEQFIRKEIDEDNEES